MILTLPSPLLVLEGSTTAGSVALVVGGVLAAQREVAMGPAREDAMLPAIAAVLTEANVAASSVRAVLCGSGPGSFTSLRIAAALAKGIVVANGAALFAVPSFLLAIAPLLGCAATYVLHADALRGERYVLTVTVHDDRTFEVSSALSRATFEQTQALADATGAIAVAVGPMSTNSGTNELLQPCAANAIGIASYLNRSTPVDVASWEPDYGRLAEAQVKWEVAHGHALPST